MLKPPFTALNMQELSHKACKGIFPPISSSYSSTIRTLIKNMMKVLPSQRLSSTDILELPEIESNLTTTCKKLDPLNKNNGLLGTIKMPQKIKDLAGRFPRPQYSREKLRRMNSEPSRLPSVHSSRSRAGSASSRKQWDLEKASQNKFVPRSVVNTKKQQEDYHLKKKTNHNSYFRRDSIERQVLQRAASNVVSRGSSNRRSIDIRNRNNSNNSRGRYEENKIPTQRRQWGMPPVAAKPKPTGQNYPALVNQKPPMSGNKPQMGMMRPPLGNINSNANNVLNGFNQKPNLPPKKDNYNYGGFGGIPRSNSPGLFRFQ